MTSCMQMNTDIKNALLNYTHDHNNQTIHAYRKNDEFMKYARIVDNSQCTKRNITVETSRDCFLCVHPCLSCNTYRKLDIKVRERDK